MTDSCKYCNRPTLGLVCNSCWEVELRLPEFLTQPEGRKFVQDQLSFSYRVLGLEANIEALFDRLAQLEAGAGAQGEQA